LPQVEKITIPTILLVLTIPTLILLIIYQDPGTDNFLVNKNRQDLQELKGVVTPEDILVEDNQIFVSNRGSQTVGIYDAKTHKEIKSITLSSIDDLFVPTLLSLDPDRDILYIKNDAILALDDTPILVGIELKSDRVTAKFSAQNFSFNSNSFRIDDMAFDKRTDTLYLASEHGLAALDGRTYKIRYSEFDGVTPSQIKLNPRNGFLYMINNNTISVVDGKRNEIVIPSIKVASYPANMAIDGNNNLVYVINKDANRLSIINGTTHTLDDILILSTSPSSSSDNNRRHDPDILVNAITNKIYISNYDANSVIVVDENTKKETKTISIDRPQKLALNEDSDLVYVMNTLSDSISAIDGKKDVQIMGRTPYIQEAGVKIFNDPESIAVNSKTNLIYVAGTSSVSVIDGKSDTLLTTIPLVDDPVHLTVNELTNRVYTSNCLDNSISIIDGETNKLINESIPVDGNLGCAIVADKHSDKVYFLSSNSPNAKLNSLNSTGYLDAADVPSSGMDFDLEPSPLSLYITAGLSEDYVYGFDAANSQWVSIKVGEYPRQLVINPNTALVYVVNQNSHTVSVIDKYSHDVIKNITVGTFPSDIALNNKTNMLYVTNEHSDTVSVIDGATNMVIDTIQVGNFPIGVAVNPTTNLIYVINDDSETISVIDGNTREALVGINFNINPTNSGQLICNGEKIVNASYARYNIGTTMECKAIANKDFATGIWSGNLLPDSKDISSDTLAFEIDRFGDLTANFEESSSVNLNIPFDTLLQILLIVLTAVIGWLIPGIVGFISKLRQKSKIITYMESINNSNKENVLEALRKQISSDYAKGKIDSRNYDILNERIKEVQEELHERNENTD